jgi:NAD(P)-dependent dehydrogenase (short-subunit alcohol dehydrogenase family)
MAKRWSARDIPDQGGRVAIVTGANSGIGLETARALAGAGARVILGCRDVGKGKQAEADILRTHPGASLRCIALDLADLESVRSFASKCLSTEPAIDILCNNAGIMMCPRGETKDGFELQFGTNHLGHFALTGLLLDGLQAAEHARVVTVSSLYHRMGRIDFGNLNADRRYDRTAAYQQSKLANLIFAFALARRLAASGSGVLSVASHPGWTATNLQAHAGLLRSLNRFFAQQPEQGALPSLFGCCAPGVSGADYYGPGGAFELTGPPAPAHASAKASDEEVAERLWDVSEALTQIRYAL